MATRPAEAGESLITTTFSGTATRGFASPADPTVAVCMLPGTKLVFTEKIRYITGGIVNRTLDHCVGVFDPVDSHIKDRHHDAVRFPDGSHVLVTLLSEGQRAAVVSIPPGQNATREAVAAIIEDATTAAANAIDADSDDHDGQDGPAPSTRTGGRVPRVLVRA